ncbi:MAG TPA: hypothetical protein VLA77_00300 [Candidatus Saccharimonadales bacterium]|nr:hypothetical protein [Candidatus Saccharimonadales bacterium]
MIQLNLLPDLKKEFINAQKTKHLVITSSILVTLIAAGISVLLFFYVNFGQQFQITLITNAINDKSEELSSISDVDQYLTIQNQLAALDPLHASKGVYSRLFSFLNILNPSPPNNVNLSNVQVAASESSIVFTGTTGSFEALNVFIDTLKNAQVEFKPNGEGDLTKESMFSQVMTQSSGLAKSNNQTVVSFTIKAFYNAPVFDAKNTDVQAIVPNITTTQSVTGAPIPQDQLFNTTPTEAE